MTSEPQTNAVKTGLIDWCPEREGGRGGQRPIGLENGQCATPLEQLGLGCRGQAWRPRWRDCPPCGWPFRSPGGGCWLWLFLRLRSLYLLKNKKIYLEDAQWEKVPYFRSPRKIYLEGGNKSRVTEILLQRNEMLNGARAVNALTKKCK